MRQKRPTAKELKQTLGAFIFTADDLLATDEQLRGGAIVPAIGRPRMSTAARLRSVQGATDDDVAKIAEADKAKRNEQPAASPEWITTKTPADE